MIRILIADDHAIFREGLRSLLDMEDDMRVVGEAGTGRDALSLCRALKPDVLILDLDMPGMDGMDVAHGIAAEGLGARIVVLTMFANVEYAVRMIQAGCLAFVPKYASGKLLPDIIRNVIKGEVYIPDEMKDIVERHLRGEKKSGTHALTDREMQVLAAIADGLTQNEIAEKFGLSPRTVETHKNHLMEKMGLKTKADIIKAAVRLGIIKNL